MAFSDVTPNPTANVLPTVITLAIVDAVKLVGRLDNTNRAVVFAVFWLVSPLPPCVWNASMLAVSGVGRLLGTGGSLSNCRVSAAAMD